MSSPQQHPHPLQEQKPLRVAFLHPDLGIGGAERLVVDAAVGLQSLGHKVVMYTSHHDPSHCFEETRDGTLKVIVGGNTIVPRTLFGRFYIICAILRNIHLALSLVFSAFFSAKDNKFDVMIVDQLSVSIPVLRWTGAKIFFYCHFPDKLLTKRESFLKKLYRLPVDLVEEITTGMADTIVVNSKFTANIFNESFKLLSSHQTSSTPKVLYPSLQFDKFEQKVNVSLPEIEVLKTDRVSFLSINRYERKKDINLAIQAFARLLLSLENKETSSRTSSGTEIRTPHDLRLVIAGGYDIRITENVEHHKELVQLAEQTYGLKCFTITASASATTTVVPRETQVLFLQSISDAQKRFLLQSSRALLYTPTNEHFGIVPVEAMYMKCPVLAVNSGGPTESILHQTTGYLCPADEQVWAETMEQILTKTEQELQTMGQAGHDRVVALFSLEAFVTKLNGMLQAMVHSSSSSFSRSFASAFLVVVVLTSLVVVVLAVLFKRTQEE
ncbi:Alpha-1,3-mannosyltransferase-like protein [Podila humilis]|nr:Alpha-1,3-mannosyltransferase-like protein [Podila humilis]